MTAIPRIEEVESRRGLRCRARIGHGEQIWRGVTWVATLESFCIEMHGQPAPTFGEGDAITVQLDSTALGQMTAVAKVTSLEIQNRAGNSASARIEVEPARQDDVSCVAFQARMAGLKPLILSVRTGERLRSVDFPGFRMDEAITLNEAARLLEEDDVAVVVFGPSVKPLEISNLLQSRSEQAPARSVHIVLYEETPPSAFQDLVDEDAIFYLTHASIETHELRATISAALRCYARQDETAPSPAVLTADENERLTNLCLSLTRKSDLPGLARALSEELADFLRATQARCLFYDPQTDTLRAADASEGEQEPISAAAGLVGYVARTGERIRIELAANDPRYDPEADNPGGTVESHFIAQPLSGAGGVAIGVLTATRAAHLSPFTAEDETRLEVWAGRAAPVLDVVLSDLRTRQLGAQGDDLNRNLYRKEALDYEDSAESEGRLLRGIPQWLAWSHLLIVVFLVIGIAYVVLAKVHQVVTGPAVIRVSNKIAVPALSSGVIATLLVAPNDRVTEGELLATLQSEPGDSLLARMREEVRAPADGIVSSIDIRPGQAVAIGEQVLSLSGEGSSNEVLALLPGSYAPQVHAGMPLVLKIDGYPQSREELTIIEVAPDIVGPSDAERYVGKEIAQTLLLSGPILMVRAALPQDTFESANERFHYRDGMVARAEVSVREEPLITVLVPGIKQLYDAPRISLGPGGGTDGTGRGRP
jgi:membrane fusion protein (multidrug efflux system)